jgi:hypothetical protein
MPGWTASVDGTRTPIYRGNLAQRVIPLWHPGRHTIGLDYVPPGFLLGCILTALSLLIWGLACIVAMTTPPTILNARRPRLGRLRASWSRTSSTYFSHVDQTHVDPLPSAALMAMNGE